MNCADLSRALDAYVDLELDASQVLVVEQHLAACEGCAERVAFTRAMKRAVRAEARAEAAPASLRARLARGIEAGAARGAVVAIPASGPVSSRREPRAPSWRSALPWAAAAAVALAIGGGVRVLGESVSTRSTQPLAQAQATHLPVLDDFAEHHARPFPPEEIDPVRISHVFSPIVGVPVRPVRFVTAMGGENYRFAGARLAAVHDEAAASLYYDVGGNRVTVFVFDPRRISIRSSCCLSPRVVKVRDQDRTVFVGRAKGYPLAVQENDGVGYAVSADLGEAELVNMAANFPSP